MKNELYFKDEESEICYGRKHWENIMEQQDVTELELREAIKSDIPGVFWCKKQEFSSDKSEFHCGKQCSDYVPKNGVSGCCVHYSTVLYECGEKIILKSNRSRFD